mgnify:CR=1 FL=1
MAFQLSVAARNALLDAIDTSTEKSGQASCGEGFLSSEGFAAIAEEGAEDGTAGAAHAAHHRHADGGEGFLDAFDFAGVELLRGGTHAALHAHAMIPVSEITVGLGQHRLGSDDALAGEQEHGFDFVFGKVGFGHGSAIVGALAGKSNAKPAGAAESGAPNGWRPAPPRGRPCARQPPKNPETHPPAQVAAFSASIGQSSFLDLHTHATHRSRLLPAATGCTAFEGRVNGVVAGCHT